MTLKSNRMWLIWIAVTMVMAEIVKNMRGDVSELMLVMVTLMVMESRLWIQDYSLESQ